MADFNDILGFNPSDLAVFNEPETKNDFNSNIYKALPKDSKSEDYVYRATIKVIYNPHDLRMSVLERQSYAMEDSNGFFQVVSKLTKNDKDCPVFKAWKTCHFSKEPVLQNQALTKDKGGKGLFDKRFERFVTIQVIEDKNHPEYEGRFMFFKCPKAIWETINNKMNPSPESGKAAIPVMDFLFGRAIELEVKPGPDDPAHPERKQREISYQTSELSEDVVSCVNPDGSSMLTDAEQTVLDTYVDAMTKVWKEKNPAKRAEMLAEVRSDNNTIELGKIYNNVLAKIKELCPNLIEELGYKDWTPEVTTRVNSWISVVVNGGDPKTQVIGADGKLAPIGMAAAVATPTATATVDATPVAQSTPVAPAADETSDLPF